MEDSKSLKVPLESHYKLSTTYPPKSEKEQNGMRFPRFHMSLRLAI